MQTPGKEPRPTMILQPANCVMLRGIYLLARGLSMSASFPGHSMPAASTAAPLEMLLACHHRIRHFCDQLQRLDQHTAQGKDTQQAQQAAASIRRFFNIAAVDHHEDEEEDLFPALLESMAGSD